MSPTNITINSHTTASLPRPHILYVINFDKDGEKGIVKKRYSDFVQLHNQLGGPTSGSIPPKRILITTFLPAKWLDDSIITERKSGLESYLNDVFRNPELRDSEVLVKFLGDGDNDGEGDGDEDSKFHAEDALPSTLSRKEAMTLLAKLDMVNDDGHGDGEGVVGENGDIVEISTAPKMIAAAYYPDWVEWSWPPENLTFGKFDILFFSFAIPTSSGTMTLNGPLLSRLVSSAKKSGKNTKIVLSVGGWGGSRYFSHCVSNDSRRKKFCSEIKQVINKYGLAGVDLDWEYPNSSGAGNPHSSSDSSNLLKFLKLLRNKLGSSKIISAAVPHLPWLGSNGRPMSDLRAYAKEMDFNYDVWGSSSNPGPNAPLGDKCGNSALPHMSAKGSFKAWNKAGFPASKIMLGLAFYGYVSRSSKTKLSGRGGRGFLDGGEGDVEGEGDEEREEGIVQLAHPGRTAPGITTPDGDTTNPTPTPTPTPIPTLALDDTEPPHEEDGEVHTTADLRSYWGQQIAFNKILSLGALKRIGGKYGATGGFHYGWDDCSNTPFLYRQNQQTVITFDDPYSLADKTKYAQSVGMAGCFVWSLDQDDGFALMDAVRTAMGRAPPSS